MRLISLWRMYDSFADIWMLMQCFRNKNQIIPIKCSKLKAIVHGNDYIFSFLIRFRFFFFYYFGKISYLLSIESISHLHSMHRHIHIHSQHGMLLLIVCMRSCVCVFVWEIEREQNTYSGKIEKEKSQIK